MFTKENAKEIGRKGGLSQSREDKARAGKVSTEKKHKASITNMLKAREAGQLTGRPPLGCDCGKLPHSSRCRVYLAKKKRESRARLNNPTN